MRLRLFLLCILVETFCPVFTLEAHKACQKSCPNGSCCEIDDGVFKCCPYVNGVCCSGGKFCCPQGSLCNNEKHFCEHPKGLFTSLSLLRSPVPKTLRATESPKSPVVCPDRISTCSERSTCCSMGNGSWGCCNMPDAVCCEDNLHCCPEGTKCNIQGQSCHPTAEDSLDAWATLLLGTPSWPTLGKPRVSPSTTDAKLFTVLNNTMAYTGVKCDDTYECPSDTTCCLDTAGEFGCCPMSEAVCCTDHIHCCPKNTLCDVPGGRCIAMANSHLDVQMATQASLFDLAGRGHVLCPDSHSVCSDYETCCRLSDGNWGCCPVPNAVCCSDGQHCCPTGFKCDMSSKTCVKSTTTQLKNDEVICPNEEFRCEDATTCCALPNDEWACCPFDEAVCCPDMAHCCPKGTRCDLANHNCVKDVKDAQSTKEMFVPDVTSLSGVCPDRLVACPQGTCCKGIFGIYACCPLPDAVCCQTGRCCPKGTRCDDVNGECTPVTSMESPFSIPLLKKSPVRQYHKENSQSIGNNTVRALKTGDRVCPDDQTECVEDRTCCLLPDDSFGCCPLANGTCCADRRHCCPASTVCTETAQCVSKPKSPTRTVFQAEKMVPVVKVSVKTSHVPDNNVQFGEVVHATWCGGCAHGLLCCPDAAGLPNRKCCPASGGVCCPDGEYCCPKGSRCLGNGKCESLDFGVETSSAPYLVAGTPINGKTPEFLQHTHSDYFPAIPSLKARLNPAFLINDYYQKNAHLYTVCPDRERVCALSKRCCLSLKYGYVCAPIESTCCNLESDNYCPFGSKCSTGGSLCHEDTVSSRNVDFPN